MKHLLMIVAMIVLLLGLFTVSASAIGGTFDGISWDLTDGVLTLGRDGEIQTLVSRTYRDSTSYAWPWKNNKSEITSVVCKGTLIMRGSVAQLFSGLSSCEHFDLSGLDMSGVTSVNYLFNHCYKLTDQDLSQCMTWDLSNVTSMNFMFDNCDSLVFVDLSGWDISGITTYEFCGNFQNCDNLQEVTMSNMTINATQTWCMFENCPKLKTVDLHGWYVPNMGYLTRMFKNCSSLISVDLSGWNTPVLKSLEDMFMDCTSLVSIDLSDLDMGSVINTSRMFRGCTKLESFGGSEWDLSSIKNMSQMFYECTSLKSLDLSHWLVADAEDVSSLFNGCSGLEYLDISGFDTRNANTVNSMVYRCKNLSEIVIGEKFSFYGNGSVANESMFFEEPPSEKDGVLYTGKWIRDDLTYGPYTRLELMRNYTASMAGKWVWEELIPMYTINFVSNDPLSVGSVASVMPKVLEDYVLPNNTIKLFAYVFDHWEDGNGNVYANRGVVPANTYEHGDVVNLTAVFVPADTSVQMQDGEFTFSIKGDEKALFENVPAGTSYSIFEENLPEDWVLVQQSDSTGIIYPLTEAQALFLNKYQPDMATIQFTGRKLMDGLPAKAGSFAFELWEGNVLLQTKPVVNGGFVQFDILEYDKFDEGVHTYVIKEVIETDATLLYDGHEETITVEVTTDDSAEDGVVRVHAEVTHSEGTYPDIVFQNWTKPGELTLKKLVDDLLAGHENDEFRFRITFKQENGLPLTDEMTYTITP